MSTSSWRVAAREQRRADRAADAEQLRADRAAQAGLRRADRMAAAELRRGDLAAADDRRQAARAAAAAWRAAAVAAASGWVQARGIGLVFVPVILVPAVLAWSAMADYGRTVFGPVGMLLPLFSEAAMWAFAIATVRARTAGAPTGRLAAGVVVFAAAAAVMNFAHGLTAPTAGGTVGAVGAGLVMALVSVGGVTVHQLVTAAPAGPRPPPAERAAARRAARLAGRAARRVEQVRAAAVTGAVAELSADGSARLVFRPGLVTYRRRWWWPRRAELVPAIVPGIPPAGPDAGGSDSAGSLAEELAGEVGAYLDALPHPDRPTPADEAGHAPGTAQTPAPGRSRAGTGQADVVGRVPGLLARARAGIDTGALPARPSRSQVQRFLRVRAELAGAVTRALHAHDDGAGGAGRDEDRRDEDGGDDGMAMEVRT